MITPAKRIADSFEATDPEGPVPAEFIRLVAAMALAAADDDLGGDTSTEVH